MFEGGERCSQIKLDVTVKKSKGRNQACRLAGLALQAVDDNRNRKRHEVVEEFMLINDTATVACEIPIWMWEKKLDVGVSGHIDLLQIRRGRIYILDFKPKAARENEQKVASQLYFMLLVCLLELECRFQCLDVHGLTKMFTMTSIQLMQR